MTPLVRHDLDRLRVGIDGDQICFILDDFIDLQNSPAYFLPVESWQGQMVLPWIGITDTVHLPHIEKLRILHVLEGRHD